MTQPAINLKTIKEIIVSVANNELTPRFANVTQHSKKDNSIVTEADIAVQKSITQQLKENWPDIPLLGEEMSQEEQIQRLNSTAPIWCLDPLDGTSNFAAGIPYFAISLALISEGKTILGIVYDPSRDDYFQAQDINCEISATLNDRPLKILNNEYSLNTSMAIVDFKRLTKKTAARVACEPPFSSQRNFGASALDWCWLAAGRSHIYLHGNQNIWDYAAGELIFRAAGGYSATLEGEGVFKQVLEKRSVVAAVNKSLFDEWASWLKD